MKKIDFFKRAFLSLMLVFAMVCTTFGQTTIASWNFDGLTALNTINVIPANTGTGTIYLDGTNGSSYWDTTSTNLQLTAFGGSPSSGKALSVANNSANGYSVVMVVPTTGLENINIAFKTRGTSAGFNTHTWGYSTDGITFTDLAGNNTAVTSSTFLVKTVDFSSITTINNLPTVYIRLTVSGATAANGNNRIDSLEITGTIPTVVSNTATPTFTLASGVLYAPAMVTLECATPASTIYYTIDGTTPTITSTVYTTPIDVTSAMTIKAIAAATGFNLSNEASATYTFPIEVANIAAFKAANTATNSTVYKITGDLTFVHRAGRNIFVKDATGGLLIYDFSTPVIANTYNNGDIISGGVFGTYTLYNGLSELIPTQPTAVGTPGTPVQPIAITVTQLLNNYATYESQLVKLSEVTFATGTYGTGAAANINIYQGVDSTVCRNHFGTLTGVVTPTIPQDVVGFAITFNTTRQVAPRDAADIVQHRYAPTIVTNPIADFGAQNQPLSSVVLLEGSAAYLGTPVPGTFAWTTPSTMITATGTQNFSVTFTPSDTVSYLPVMFDLPVTVLTACTSQAPWIYGFEDGTNGSTLSGCFSQAYVSGSRNWTYNSSNTSYNRTPRTGSFNATLQYGCNTWLFRQFYLPEGTYSFSMFARQDYESTSHSNITVKLGTANTTAAMDAGTIIVPETGITWGDYQNLTGSITITTAGIYSVGIKGYMNYSPYYISIDDISILPIGGVGCQTPSAITVTNVGTTTADVAWTPAGTETAWILKYKEISATSWTVINATTPSYSLTGLNPSATYEVSVKASCGASQYSGYISSTFVTKCNPLVVLPYVEDFEAVAVNGFPYCFEKITTGNAYVKVVQMTGTKGIEMSTGGVETSMLILPSTQAYVNTLRLKFKYNGGANHKFKFGYITNINDASTFVQLKQDSLTVNDWYYYDLFTSNTLTGTERMAIVFDMGSGFSARLDSVTLMSQPACYEPINLAVTAFTLTSATLNWAYPTTSLPTNYTVNFRLVGDTTWTVRANVARPYNLTGLTKNNVYEYRVKANCSGGGSDWSQTFTFRTQYQVPYYQGFNAPTLPFAWTNIKTAGTSTPGIFDFVTTGSSPTCTPQAGTHMARFNAFNIYSGGVAELTTPQILGMAAGSLIKFWMYRDDGYLTNAENITVILKDSINSVNPTQILTVNRSKDLTPTVTANGWYQYIARVPAAGFNYVVFQGTSFYGNNIFFDEIEITAPVLIPVTITNGPNGTSTPTGLQNILNGTTRLINFTPSVGYRVASITINGTEVQGSDLTNSRPFAYTLNVGLDTLAVHATYEKIPYTITPSITNFHGANYLDNGNMPGTITPNTPTIVLHGESTTFTINVNQNFHLYKLMVDGVSAPFVTTGNNTFTYTFNNVTANHTIEAIVKIDTVAIVYNVIGGAGVLDGVTVTGPTTHSTYVNYGDDFLATMPAAPGYENVSTTVNGLFLGAATQYQFYNITTPQNVNVVYAPKTITIATQAYGNGTITPGTTFSYTPTYTYNYTVVPTIGNYISAILVNEVPVVVANPLNFTGQLTNITDNKLIEAYFAPLTYTINATAGFGGTITPNGIATYNYGASQEYVINAAPGYTITTITVNGTPVVVPANATTYTHTFANITANQTITATFTVNTYSITATAGLNGTITPAGVTTVDYNNAQVYTIAPAVGYHIVDVVVDGLSMGPISTYTFANVMENHTIAATFAINTYTLTASINGNGTITPAGVTTVNYGANQTYTIAPAAGSVIVDVIVDGTPMGVVTSYTFTNVDADHTIQVITSSATFNVTVTQPTNGAITPVTQVVTYGATPTFTITPNMGYMISAIIVNGTPATFTANSAGVATYTFAPIAANATITATMTMKTFTVTATAGANGTITPSGVATINYNANSAVYTFAPAAGYEVADVTVNGVSVGVVPSYQFVNVMANKTIGVTFQLIPCETPINTYTTNVSQTGATFNWNNTGATTYDVRYKSLAATDYTLIVNVSTPSVDVTGLTASTQYIWQVKANCTVTNPSLWSTEKTFITNAVAPDGVTDQDLTSVQVYSNISDIYIVNNSDVAIQNANIYDVYGKLIYSSTVINNPTVITLDVATGVYVVRLATANGTASFKVHITK